MRNAPILPRHIAMVEMLLKHQESDRGCVIFCAAFIEDHLESLLRVCCRDDDGTALKVVDSLFEGYAPFSTFSAKIQVSYALGLISEPLYKQLLRVKKLRNNFAHDHAAVSFESPKYRSQVQAIEDSYPSSKSEADRAIAKFPDSLQHINAASRAQVMNRFRFCLYMMEISARIRVAEESAAHNLWPRAKARRTTLTAPDSSPTH